MNQVLIGLVTAKEFLWKLMKAELDFEENFPGGKNVLQLEKLDCQIQLV